MQNSPGEAPAAAPRATNAIAIMENRIISVPALEVPSNLEGGILGVK